MTRPTGAYAWLNAEPGPKMLLEALKLYGTEEKRGPGSNPVILAWADELGAELGTAYAKWAAAWYDDDAKPFCGLGMAVVAQRANPDDRPERRPPDKYLAAASWATWGRPVAREDAMLGDVLVFTREGGGHVALYCAEDDTTLHVLGFNQSDSVTVAPIAKDRCIAVRRPAYLTQPANVRRVALAPTGATSINEA
jgi:uncharacterized protein (TIGR02594 family)